MANPENPHLLTFVQCGEGAEIWMRHHAPEQRWLPCIGMADFKITELERLYIQCRDDKPPYGYWAYRFDQIADTISFTGPKLSRCFAFADLCAFVYNRHEIGRDDWGLYEVLRPSICSVKRFPPK